MGFGVIKVTGKTMTFVQMNELDMRKITDPYVKLRMIFERTLELIETHHPDEIALEAPFFPDDLPGSFRLEDGGRSPQPPALQGQGWCAVDEGAAGGGEAENFWYGRYTTDTAYNLMGYILGSALAKRFWPEDSCRCKGCAAP